MVQPGKASTRHSHRQTTELYVLRRGNPRDPRRRTLHRLEPLSSVLADAEEVRQLFNDSDSAAALATESNALSPLRPPVRDFRFARLET